MADRRYGAAAPTTLTTVDSQDWYAQDISGQEHSQVAFVNVDLTEVTNHGATFSECSFRDVRLNVSTHVDAAFTNCTFTNCNFFDATFTGCKMVGSMFDRCSFDLLKVVRGNWSFVGLPGADLRKASFTDVRMREADLVGARCDGFEMLGVDLSGSWLHQAKLNGADLRGTDLSSLDPLTVELDGAVVTEEQAVTIATALGLDVRAE